MKIRIGNNILLCLTLLNTTCVALAGNVTNEAIGVFQIETRISRKAETNIVLDINIKNVGSNDILISSGYLPWDRYSMTLVLVETDPASTQLEQELVVSDPMPGDPSVLKQKSCLKGSINLADRFPQLSKTLKQNDVVVFWSYLPKTEDKAKTERTGGWNLINKW